MLRGNLGRNLRVLAAPDSHFGQISRVLNRLHTDYARDYDMTTLSRDAGMSIAPFFVSQLGIITELANRPKTRQAGIIRGGPRKTVFSL